MGWIIALHTADLSLTLVSHMDLQAPPRVIAECRGRIIPKHQQVWPSNRNKTRIWFEVLMRWPGSLFPLPLPLEFLGTYLTAEKKRRKGLVHALRNWDFQGPLVQGPVVLSRS